MADQDYIAAALARRTATAPINQPALTPGLKVGTGSPSTSPVTFNDGTRDRLQIGNLPAYTDPNGITSASQYGVRSVDASGNLIFDSSGVAQTISASGTSGPFNIAVPTTSTSYVAINSVTFTLPRTANLLAWALVQGQQTVGTGSTTMGVQIDGLFPTSWTPGGLQLQGDIVTSLGTNTTLMVTMVSVWPFVPAGSHTISVVGKVSAGTWNLSGFPVFIILGG